MNLREAINKVKVKQKDIEGGFSLIELIVVMGLLGIVLALATTNFTTLLKSLKTESKVAETETETIVGLEILRQDIEHAGYGLPWFVNDINGNGNFSDDWGAINGYTEAESQTICGSVNITNYNDGSTTTNRRSPRAILSGNNACSDGSDYLVIKSTVVRNEDESQKWTYIWNDGASTKINSWSATNENMASTTKIIALNPKQNKNDRVLVTYGTSNSFYSQLSSATTNFAPKPSEVFLLLGIGSGSDNQLRMPFNRADYFLNGSNVPSRCAAGTKILTKGIISHGSGNLVDYSPLLDCVADMQVVFGVDQTGTPDGSIDCYTNDLSVALPLYDAENIRDRVKEVRVYILAHEGQMDRNYRFGSNTIRVGDSSGLNRCDSAGVDKVLGRDFNLSSITNYQNYRWKVYTLVILPDNLKGR